MKKIVVTGGAGFIGSHVVRHLLLEGVQVVVVDDFSSGSLSNLPTSDHVSIVAASVLDNRALRTAFEGASAVVHLAAEPSVQKSIQSPFATHEVNYVGTMSVIEAARHTGVKRMVYASSAAVYNPQAQLPLSESSQIGPISPYGVDKLSGEFLLNCMSSLYGIDTVALRFFNVYGERQDPKSAYSGVISLFIDAIVNGSPLKIFGDGQQTRDFVYAGDVASAVHLAASKNLSGHHVLNIGTGVQTTLCELVASIEHAYGREAIVEFHGARQGDIRDSYASIRSAQDVLGYEAITSLREGLSLMRTEALDTVSPYSAK